MKKLLAAVAVTTISTVIFADESIDETENNQVQAEEVQRPQQPPPKYFTTLPVCKSILGSVEVMIPGSSEWKPVEVNRYYPLGALFRTLTVSSKLEMQLGKKCFVTLYGNSSFGTKAQGLDDMTRTIVLGQGELKLRLPQNMQDGFMFVSSSGFKVTGLSGESKYIRKLTGDGDDVRIKCSSGSLSVEGMHFKVLQLRAQNAIRLRTSQDMLFTCITGIGGDYMSKLFQGLVEIKNYETGTSKIEEKYLDWKISPQTNVRIHRSRPQLGKNLSVVIMTFDASGVLCNSCAFTEGRYEINTGETAPTAKDRKAELIKKSQESADTGSVVTDSPAEESSEEKTSESTENKEENASDDNFDF